METFENFLNRVFDRTGTEVSDMIEISSPEGHIVCRRGQTYIVFVGDPQHVDEDGIEYWPPCAARIVNAWALSGAEVPPDGYVYNVGRGFEGPTAPTEAEVQEYYRSLV